MEPFLGQIQAFGFDYPPRGWAECNGQLLPIAQNSALFSLLGTIYGGDGRTTFALPDLRGRSIVHMGTGPGLNNVRIGQKGGAEGFTLTAAEMPSHSHGFYLAAGSGDQFTGNGNAIANVALNKETGASNQLLEIFSTAALSSEYLRGIGNTGGGQYVYKRSPFLTVNVSIALQGVFPPRS